MVKTAKQQIDDIIRVEGGFVDHPNDPGGATKYGITEAVARQHGYQGRMEDLSRETAFAIYEADYWTGPRFDKVAGQHPELAHELMDTGVNMGPATAVRFLQRWLNVANQQASWWQDMQVDGVIGPRTLGALRAYYQHRPGDEGRRVILAAVDSLQAARYIDLAENREASESFVYGWLRARTFLPPA